MLEVLLHLRDANCTNNLQYFVEEFLMEDDDTVVLTPEEREKVMNDLPEAEENGEDEDKD